MKAHLVGGVRSQMIMHSKTADRRVRPNSGKMARSALGQLSGRLVTVAARTTSRLSTTPVRELSGEMWVDLDQRRLLVRAARFAVSPV
jgi:hypothetical protein